MEKDTVVVETVQKDDEITVLNKDAVMEGIEKDTNRFLVGLLDSEEDYFLSLSKWLIKWFFSWLKSKFSR